MADILENLNERQREAVLETEGYVRVIAGAGSGKTKLLVSRYAYLVQDYGIDSSNILCVTFTNKAAGEMKKRIRRLIGEDNDVSLICTYHGFCNRLLRENPEKLFLSKQFQIIDAGQQKAILGEIYQKLELKLDYATFEAILRKIGRAKKDMSYVAKMCNPRPCQILTEIKTQDDRIIEDFLQRQKATYSLDFHDLIAFAIHLLETDPQVREKWQERLNYIMVDEFQDSSKVEMRLVEILSGLYQNLMIVGDPDQNIYEWRGSDVKLLVDFDKEHEPTKTIILNQNYRSTPQILQCANTLIEKNEMRLKKDLFTKNPIGAPVIHYHSRDDFEEMDIVIANIKKLQEKEGFRYSDFAIIYRAGFLSRIPEKKLVEKNIPYEIFGGVRFYQRMEILDMLAYLKLIAYDDDSAFRRVVNTPRRRFGRAKMNLLEQLRERERLEQSWMERPQKQLRMEQSQMEQPWAERVEPPWMKQPQVDQSWAEQMEPLLDGGSHRRCGAEVFSAYGEDGSSGSADRNSLEPTSANNQRNDGGSSQISLFTTLSRHLDEREFQGSDVGNFVNFIRSIRKSYPEKRISEIVNEVAAETGYESYIRELGDEERLDNLAEFKRIANEFERDFGEHLSLEGFLQQIALQSGEDSDDDRDTVKLMTIHSAKGLEFPAVFILGFTEGVFPSSKTMGDRKKPGLEEERRLCYVAITRAEKYLFLMESEGASANGMKKLVSRFLEEIGEQNYVRIGRISEELKRESRGYAAKLNQEMLSEPVGTRAVGDEVEHHVFGKGKILAIDEKRGSYSIQFEKLQLPRNISSGYFQKAHTDLRQAPQSGKAEESGAVTALKTELVLSLPEIENFAESKTAGQKNIVEGKASGLEKDAAAVPYNKPESVKPSDSEGFRKKVKTDGTGENWVFGEQGEIAGHERTFPERMSVGESNALSQEKQIQNVEDNAESRKGESETAQSLEEMHGNDVPEPEQSLEEESRNRELESAEGSEKELQYPEVCEKNPEESDPDSNQSARLKALKADSPNLWKREDVPHSGWTCVGVEDLGAPVGICQMCGYQIIRYAHQMEHPDYGSLSVGCVCAGKMEGDVAGAKHREAEFKKKQSRRIRFLQRKWKRSQKGNEYLKVDGHVVVLCQDRGAFSAQKNLQQPQNYRTQSGGGGREAAWKYAIDNVFCKTAYATRERAVAGVFDALEKLKEK